MIKCITIDDEPLALDLLEDFISKVPFLQLVQSCQNPMEAIEFLHKEEIQLMFLDIQMPQITGMQFLKSLEDKPKVIFTTAYSDYALQGFDLDAVDYLLKPFTFERFLKAVNKAYQLILIKPEGNSGNFSIGSVKEYMFVKSGYDTVKVKFKNIRFIEGLKDYVKIHTTEGTILSLLNMKTLTDELPDNFIRIHRSFIIDFNRIERVQKKKVLIEGKEIPIGDVYREEFLTHLHKKS